MQSFGEEYSAHYYLQYGVELIQWTVGSASGLGGAEGLSPPEHSGNIVGLEVWTPLHQS
jgi:hypothetical protein